MATSYPGSLDNFTNPTSTSPINSPSHADQHSNANDAIEAIESELGTNPKGAKATVKARLDDVDTAIALKAPIASPTFTGTVTIPAGSAITGVPYLATANTFTGNNTFASPIVAFVGTSGSYSSAAVSGYNIIHLSQGMILINSQTGGDYNLATNAYYNSGWKYFESTGSTLINFGNGRFDFNTASSGTAGNAITYTSKMTIANSGTVTINGFGAATQGLIVKAAASQTANLQEWQNSAGTALAKISNVGNLTIKPIPFSGGVSGGIYLGDTSNAWADGAFEIKVNNAGTPRFGFTAPNAPTEALTIIGNSVGVQNSNPQAYLHVNSYNAGNKALIVQGYASQTANLQEWQNSNGTVLASIDANGQASFKSTTLTASSSGVSSLTLVAASGQTAPLLITSGGAQIPAGGNYFRAPGIEATYVMNVTSGNLGTIPFIVKGAASQTADLQQWQDSAGTVLAYVAANGHLLTPRLNITNGGNIVDSAGTTPYFAFGSNQIAIYARNAAYKPLVIQGAASQSANLQEWQQSDGTVTSYVGGDGNIFVQNARALFVNSGYIGSASLVTKAAGPTWSGLIVKAATSQTANLQEWQDSSGNVLSKIDSFGAFKTASTASFGTISGGGVWGGYAPVVEIRNTSTSTSAINIFANGGPAIRVYDGSGYQRGAWNQDGSIVVGQNNTKLATLSVYADSAASVGTIIRGAASQTADLQQWQNSAGNSVAVISPGGNLDIALRLTAYNGVSAYNASTFGDPGILLPYTYSNVVGISTGFAGNVGLVIKGFTSQSGDLQQWRDSSGNILTGISSNGLIYSGKSYSSYNIESAGTLASSESIANTFNLQGKNNLIYPSIITDVGGNGWTSVTSNYGIAPDGTQTSTRYVWNSPGNCFATASDSNPNTYVGEIYTVSAYIKINAGTGSVALRYSKADSSKNAGIQINLSTKTATSVFDASDYNVLSYSLIPVGKNWYRAIATIKVLVNHTIERVMLAATNSVGDIEVWGFQLERGLSASPLTPTTNALVTTVNTLNIPYGQINLQSNASTIGLIIKSANAPTVNLTEWQTSTGAVVASIDPNGSAFFNSNFQINGVVAIGGGPQAYSQLIIQTNSATRNGLVIKAASSQTADLQQWQNNTGTTLAAINSIGELRSKADSDQYLVFQNKATGTTGNYGLYMDSTNNRLQIWTANSPRLTIAGAGDATFSNDVIISGNLTVNGTTTNINTTNLVVEDKNITIADVTTPTDTTADGAGITIKGATDKTLNWVQSTSSFTSSDPFIINTNSTTIPNLILKQIASQTADLQQWQDSAGTVKASIRPSGGLSLNYANSIRLYNTANTDYAQLWMDNGSGGTNLYVKTNYPVLMGDIGVDTGASLTVATQSTGQVGQVIRAKASQTANLQEWQNSSGTVLSSISSNGNLVSNLSGTSTTFPIFVYTTSSLTTPYGIAVARQNRSDQYIHIHESDGSKAVIEAVAPNAAKPFFIKNKSNEALYLGTNDTNRFSITSTGLIGVGIDTPSSAQMTLINSNSANTGLLVKGAASQTANLQEWQDSGGTTLAYVKDNGYSASIAQFAYIYTSAIQGWNGAGGSISFANASPIIIAPQSASTVVLAIKGAASQSANLQEWQNNSGTVLAKINKDGIITVPAINVVGQSISSNTTMIAGYRYFVDTSASRTLTLPSSATIGDEIQIFDSTNTAGTNNITINSNNGKIEGVVESYIIDVNGAAIVMTYTGSTYGWKVRM